MRTGNSMTTLLLIGMAGFVQPVTAAVSIVERQPAGVIPILGEMIAIDGQIGERVWESAARRLLRRGGHEADRG